MRNLSFTFVRISSLRDRIFTLKSSKDSRCDQHLKKKILFIAEHAFHILYNMYTFIYHNNYIFV